MKLPMLTPPLTAPVAKLLMTTPLPAMNETPKLYPTNPPALDPPVPMSTAPVAATRSIVAKSLVPTAPPA
ncbi:hypothetical protein CHKEEEPN_0528 [Methylorubrum podarium]|nr:hypothetical protein CHKEEEPN_0528 [Methylorubrum podarium]